MFFDIQLHIDGHHGPQSPNSPDHKDQDFFKEVENQSFPHTVTIPTNGKNGNGSGKCDVIRTCKCIAPIKTTRVIHV